MNEFSDINYFYPNKMGRVVLLSMQEVLSNVGLNAVLNLAGLHHRINHFPPNDLERAYGFDELGQMMATLESLYGPRGGRGLALRAGRACFKYGLREFGPLVGSTDIAFRLLPLESKLRMGAKLFTDVFNKFSDQLVRVEENDSQFLWHIERCPVCWGRHADAPICHLAVGVLQEAMYWVSSGKYFNIEEVSCIAKGDPACTILIEKQVIE